MRLGRVALLALGVTLLAACSAPPGSGGPPDPDAPVVAFYGDSYTLGTGASDPANRWSTIICADRGWTEFNPSVNGLGFVNNRGARDLPGEIVAQRPDLVIVTMGLNDNFSYDRAGTGIRDRITADLALLAERLPDARIIVVEPFWYTDARPESVEIIIDWVHAGAVGIGADWIPGASHWIEGHPEWMAADGLHPNDAGYAEMARRMDAELAQLGL
jgi:lysophospholipase L1-like esterase